MLQSVIGLLALLPSAPLFCEYEIEYIECAKGADLLTVNEKNIVFSIKNSFRAPAKGKHAGNVTVVDGQSHKHVLAYSFEIKEADTKRCRVGVQASYRYGDREEQVRTSLTFQWMRRNVIGGLNRRDSSVGFIVKVSPVLNLGE